MSVDFQTRTVGAPACATIADNATATKTRFISLTSEK
jgi:hypothetical protein